MSVLGIGVDLTSVARFEGFSERMLKRLFTEKEQEYCSSFKQSAERYAGRFAAKEAIAKAIGKGIREEIRFLDMEILPNQYGAPQAILLGQMKEEYPHLKIHLSITHDVNLAIAYVTIEVPD